MTNNLPSYENPPLIEVVCGVQFDALHNLHAPYIGKFWAEIEKEFPVVQTVQPLDPVRENLGESGGAQTVTFSISNVPPMPRVWLSSADETGLVQIQNVRFLYNWRRQSHSPDYPRFESVYANFTRLFSIFKDTLRRYDVSEVCANQFELTYINGIELEDINGQLKSIGSILPDIPWREDRGRLLESPEYMALKTGFKLPDNFGRLHLLANSALNVATGKPVLQLELTARGFNPEQPNGQDQWFELAHEWIVGAFEDVTHEEVQKNSWSKNV